MTTRVAVKTHRKRGDAEMVVASARRGLELLGGIGGSLDDGASSEVRDMFDQAYQELTALADPGGDGMTAISVEADDSALNEDVNLRPKLGP